MAGLKKTLGVYRGTALMVNIVLGAGLLTVPGLAYRDVGSDAVYIWLLCAIVAVPLIIVFAMTGRACPDAGGIPALFGRQYGTSAYRAATFLFFGAVALGLPGVALTGGYYAARLIDVSPYALGAALVVLATAVNFLSASVAGRVNEAIASLLVIVLVAVVVSGALAVTGTPNPALSAPGFELPTQSYTAVFMMVFFAFTGWEVAAHLSEEFRNPRRDIPLAMAGSFVIAVAFYLSLAVIVGKSSLTGHYEAPFVAILEGGYGPLAAKAMAVIAVVMIFANLSAAIWAVSRMVFSAAREGVLPAALRRTRQGTPLRAVAAVLSVLLSAITLAAAGILPLNALLEFAGQNFLILYGCAALALLRMSIHATGRAIAGLAIYVVAGLLFLRDPLAMIYPILLVLAALLVPFLKRRVAGARRGSAVPTSGS
jgi:amino acid efflux transporter